MSDINAAIQLAAHDIKIIPVHGIKEGLCTCGHADCDKPGKHPIYDLYSWKFIASTCPAVIRAWLTLYPWANIAIPCEHNRLIILDVDDPTSLNTLINERPEWFQTWMERTGRGGYHAYYKQPKKLLTQGFNAHGIEVKINNYVVCAPSKHVNGCYQWLPGHAPSDIDLMEIPADLIALLRPQEKQDHPPVRLKPIMSVPVVEQERRADIWLNYYTIKAIRNKLRSTTCYGMGRQLKAAGVTLAIAIDTGRRYGRRVNHLLPKDHAFTEQEAEDQIRRAFQAPTLAPPKRRI